MLTTLIPMIICIVASTVFICLGCTKGKLYGLISKIVASACFVGAGIFAITQMDDNINANMANHPDWAWFLVAGLILGLVGDIFMDLKEQGLKDKDMYLNTGLLSFGIGHFMYYAGLTLCVPIRCNILIPTAIALVLGVIITILIFVNAGSMKIEWGKFKWQSFVYSVALVSMFVYAVAITILDKTRWIFALAMGLFLISDLLLSLIYFGKRETKTMHALNWITYYAAQQLIVLFMFLI